MDKGGKKFLLFYLIKSKGLEIELNKGTIYRQIHLNKEKLSKKDLMFISNQLGLPELNKNNTKSDMIDGLLNNIYQSNYLDSLERIGSKTK